MTLAQQLGSIAVLIMPIAAFGFVIFSPLRSAWAQDNREKLAFFTMLLAFGGMMLLIGMFGPVAQNLIYLTLLQGALAFVFYLRWHWVCAPAKHQ